ncbi:MAG TPA: hypothetical protein VFW33_00765, partial [Gemmataceae bacterium]|nr:hypothetical protein [Gemmataceae bacterium]
VILPGIPAPDGPRPVPVLIDVAAARAIPLDVRPDRDPDVRNAFWSPDGRRLACVHADNSITTWDGATGARRQRLVNRTPGTLVTTASGPLRFRCAGAEFEMQTPGLPLRTDFALFAQLLWSSDGRRLLAVAGPAVYAKLWDVPEEGGPREIALFLKGEGIEVGKLRFSPDGRLLAAPWQAWTHPDGGGKVRALLRGWHADSGEEAFRLAHSAAGSVAAFAWAPDGRLLATAPAATPAGEDVKIWDSAEVLSAATPKEVSTCAGSGGAAALAFAPSPAGRSLATLDADRRTLRTWSAGKPQAVNELKSPGFLWDPEDPRPERAGPWSPDATQLWSWTALPSGGDESLPVAWSVRGGEALAPKPRFNRFTLFAWAPDGGRALTLEDGTARVWDLPRWLPAVSGEVAWAPDGEHVLRPTAPAAPWPAVIPLGGAPVPYLGHNGGPVGAVAWSRDGRRLATAAADRTVKVWDRDTGRLLRSIPCPGPDPVWRLAWSKGDKRLLGEAMHQGEVRVVAWDAEGGIDPVLTLVGPWQSAPHSADWSSSGGPTQLSSDGSALATVGLEPPPPAAPRPALQPGSLRVWDVNTDALRLEVPAKTAGFSYNEPTALSADGSRLAHSGFEPAGVVTRVWDAGSRKELTTVKVSSSRVFAAAPMALSPDGTRLACLPPSSPARLELFDAATGARLAEGKTSVSVQNGQPRWAPDGKRLLAVPVATPAGWAGPDGMSFFSLAVANAEVIAEMKLEPHERLLLAPQWSPASDLVVAPVWGSRRKTAGADAEPPVRLMVWDPGTGRRLGTLGGGMNGAAWDLAWSPDGKTIAVAGHDRAVRLWDVSALRPGADAAAVAALGVSRVIDGHAGDAGPDGVNRNLYFYPPGYGQPGPAAGPVRAAAWRPDGRLVATACGRIARRGRSAARSAASTCGTPPPGRRGPSSTPRRSPSTGRPTAAASSPSARPTTAAPSA